MAESLFGGLDLLPSSVVLLDGDFAIRYMNPAAESLLGTSDSAAHGSSLEAVAGCPATLVEAMHNALAHGWSHSGPNIEIRLGNEEILHLNCSVNRIEAGEASSGPSIRRFCKQHARSACSNSNLPTVN